MTNILATLLVAFFLSLAKSTSKKISSMDSQNTQIGFPPSQESSISYIYKKSGINREISKENNHSIK
jgi:cell division protein FtsN